MGLRAPTRPMAPLAAGLPREGGPGGSRAALWRGSTSRGSGAKGKTMIDRGSEGDAGHRGGIATRERDLAAHIEDASADAPADTAFTGHGAVAGSVPAAAHWLARLTAHVERQRRRHPFAELAVLIDVDGTLLDLRPGLLARLLAWDARQQRSTFAGLEAADLVPNEAGLRRLFDARGLDYAAREELLVDCERFCWSPEAVLGAHRPCLGMLEVLRWMQMQPGVYVVLNSSRAQERRDETVQALRTLCRHYGMGLAADRLHLAPSASGADPVEAKLAGIEHFRERGFVPVALVDDDPRAVARIERDLGDRDVLCLAGTPFERRLEPVGETDGDAGSPRPVSVVWTDLESMDDLELFGAANVPWAQVRVGRNDCAQLATVPRRGAEIQLEELIGAFAQLGRGLRLCFDETSALTRALDSIGVMRFPLDRVAVHLADDQQTDAWFQRLAAHVEGGVSVSADGGHLIPLARFAPDLASQALVRLVDAGVARLVLPADAPDVATFATYVRAAGLEVELAVEGASVSRYVDAVLRAPHAVSTDFDRQHSRRFDPRAQRGSGSVGALRV